MSNSVARRLLLPGVVAIALGLNAWIHFRLAAPFDANPGTLLSQGALFRIQGIADIAAGILVLVRPRWWSLLLAFGVAAGGAAVLLATTVFPVDGTALGLPYLFEPAWYPAKQTSLVLQVVAAVAVLASLVKTARTPRPGAV